MREDTIRTTDAKPAAPSEGVVTDEDRQQAAGALTAAHQEYRNHPVSTQTKHNLQVKAIAQALAAERKRTRSTVWAEANEVWEKRLASRIAELEADLRRCQALRWREASPMAGGQIGEAE